MLDLSIISRFLFFIAVGTKKEKRVRKDYPFLSYPFLSCPFRKDYPILSFPKRLSYPFLSFPFLYRIPKRLHIVSLQEIPLKRLHIVSLQEIPFRTTFAQPSHNLHTSFAPIRTTFPQTYNEIRYENNTFRIFSYPFFKKKKKIKQRKGKETRSKERVGKGRKGHERVRKGTKGHERVRKNTRRPFFKKVVSVKRVL